MGMFNLLWEIPLSVLSYLFFKVNKGIIGWLYARYLARNLKRAVTWRMLSAETLKIPIILPVLMTKGPRWNTHGVIGTLGPFAIDSTLTVDLEQAQNSAKSWTVVIYSYPKYETVTQLSWLTPMSEQNNGTLLLPKGYYSLGIRYYGVQEQAVMPTVTFDQQEPLPGISVPKDNNRFYDTLSDRTNLYYLSLHYYIHTLLRLRKSLPQSVVRSEYLPVGDPDTTFLYDYFNRGEALNVQIKPDLFTGYQVFLSVYNRSSLPIFSDEVKTSSYLTPSFQEHGYFLFRLRPKINHTVPIADQDMVIQKVLSPVE